MDFGTAFRALLFEGLPRLVLLGFGCQLLPLLHQLLLSRHVGLDGSTLRMDPVL